MLAAVASDVTIILRPDDDGGYTAFIPSKPGCISDGETIAESLRNLAEAVELWDREA